MKTKNSFVYIGTEYKGYSIKWTMAKQVNVLATVNSFPNKTYKVNVLVLTRTGVES